MKAKICGLKTPADVAAAVDGGAAYVGFVFFPPSPRNVSPSTAKPLAESVPEGVVKVALVVNPTDAEISEILSHVTIDMLQLHGSETPERVSELRRITGLPVMKAVGVAQAADLETLDRYEEVADQILVDAKPAKDATRPGGNGLSFDWNLIAGRDWKTPWMLAGGLTPDNLSQAAELTGANQVDASSSLESASGVKDPTKIAAFLQACQKGRVAPARQ
ncbi:MAG: phosphoribosylanthranilate isomerase [Pseudomonadota bacterium]